MTKVLLLLSAVAMALGIFISYQNRQTFLDARTARFENDTKIANEKKTVDTVAGQVADLKTNVAAMNNEVSQEQERLQQAAIKKKNVEKEAETATTELTSVSEDIKKFKAQASDLPQGVTIETINEDINRLKQTIADNEGKVAKAQEEAAAKQKDIKKAQDELTEVQKRIEERKKLFERNRLTATIVAVNNDWGFVVIEGGSNKSITTETKLLVTRGNDTIGKLDIVAVEPNKTLANIVQKSVRPGFSIAPGDKVILETLYQ